MISELPARATTQTEIDRVKSHMERIEMEGKKYAAVLERKRKQYALLFHVLEELQRAPAEDVALDQTGDALPGASTAMEVE